MRITTMAPLVVGVALVAGCGAGGGKSAALVRPPSPVYLSVYVNNGRISVYPASVGAGPVVFQVANQSSQSEALSIAGAGGSPTVASTAPINPQGTTQVTADMKPGDYTIQIAPQGHTQAQLTEQSPIRSAAFHIGSQRSNSSGQVLQP